MFWRSWHIFALLTGLSMDYYTPLEHRTHSFKEFMNEWIIKQLFPVQGIFEGDFVVLLVPVDTDDPMTVVAQKIAHHVAGRRVAAQDRPMRVRHQGKFLADEATVAEADLAPLDVLEVVYA